LGVEGYPKGKESLSLQETMLGCAFVDWIEETDMSVEKRAFMVENSDFDAQ
jgi:hypothetical protein